MTWQEKKNEPLPMNSIKFEEDCWKSIFCSPKKQIECESRSVSGDDQACKQKHNNIEEARTEACVSEDIDYMQVFRNIDEDESYQTKARGSEDTNVEEDDSYNTNIDVVGTRNSFEEGEKLNFMASQRIHYYKMEDVNEIFNQRNPNYEIHSENIRNIIMSMSNNYGGLVMFGLGKNKTVQGLQLSVSQRNDFIKLFTNVKNSINGSQHLVCNIAFLPIFNYRIIKNSQALHLFEDAVRQEEEQILFAPFSNKTSAYQPFDDDWSKPATRPGFRSKEWVIDRYIIRVCIDQGKKLDETYVYIKNKEMVSAIFDKQSKIFKPIYGAPLINKIISKAKTPCNLAQKLKLAEPDKEGLQASELFANQESREEKTKQKQSEKNNQIEHNCIYDVQDEDSLNFEGIKIKRGQKIINDNKKKMIKEKNQKYQLFSEEKAAAKKVTQIQPVLSNHSSTTQRESTLIQSQQIHSSTIQNSVNQPPLVTRVEFVGFEHSGNAKSFVQHLDKVLGQSPVPHIIEMYDTLFFEVEQKVNLIGDLPAFQKKNSIVKSQISVSQEKEEKQQDWMERLVEYLLTGDNWKNIIINDKIFKKLLINGRVYQVDESKQWVCFQNVKNKAQFQQEIFFLEQRNIIERVNFYHQNVFKVLKTKEFDQFFQSNYSFKHCFVADTIKKGFSNSHIVIKGLKLAPKAQDFIKNLLGCCTFNVSQQGPSFFVCEFNSPLDSFLAMERLINHRKQKMVTELFTSGHLDAFIELQDKSN